MDLKNIAQKLRKAPENIILIYAFNATGKTSLSIQYNEISKDEKGDQTGVCYNAISEDLFRWDNDNIKLNIVPSKLNIYHNNLTEERILKRLALYNNEYNFYVNPIKDDNPELGIDSIVFFLKDDVDKKPIKISRGEERIFIWCFFLALFDIIKEQKEEREEEQQEVEADDRDKEDESRKIEYFFIDDPVSSLDDNNIYTTAGILFELFDDCILNNQKIIVTTHHLGLFSILNDWLYKGENADKYIGKKVNYEKDNNGDRKTTKLTLEEYNKYKIWILEKRKDENNKSNYQLKSRNNGAYLYHLLLLQKIKDDIDADNLYRYHFSLLRQVLEIIASFMGKNRRIGQVLNFIEEDDDMVNQINANAHKDIFDYQDGKLVQDNKEVIIRIYNKLITKFNFNLKKV